MSYTEVAWLVDLVGFLVVRHAIRRMLRVRIRAGRVGPQAVALIEAATWATLPVVLRLTDAVTLPWSTVLVGSGALLVLYGGAGLLVLPRISGWSLSTGATAAERLAARRGDVRTLAGMLIFSSAACVGSILIMVLSGLSRFLWLPALALAIILATALLFALGLTRPNSSSPDRPIRSDRS